MATPEVDLWKKVTQTAQPVSDQDRKDKDIVTYSQAKIEILS